MHRSSSEFRLLTFPEKIKKELAQTAKAPATPPSNSLDKAGWEAYSSVLAAQALTVSPVNAITQQQVSEGNYSLDPIDTNVVDEKIAAFEDFEDKLSTLAKKCINSPKTGCAGNIPPPPDRIPSIVRTFTPSKEWDTASGPVDIVLDSASICKLDSLTGSWRIADAPSAPVLACNASLPKEVINGHIVTGGFDSYYGDNHGKCTYVFVCFRK